MDRFWGFPCFPRYFFWSPVWVYQQIVFGSCAGNIKGIQYPTEEINDLTLSDSKIVLRARDGGPVYSESFLWLRGCNEHYATRGRFRFLPWLCVLVPLALVNYWNPFSLLCMFLLSMLSDFGTAEYAPNFAYSMLFPSILLDLFRNWTNSQYFDLNAKGLKMVVTLALGSRGVFGALSYFHYNTTDVVQAYKWAVATNGVVVFFLCCSCPSQGWSAAIWLLFIKEAYVRVEVTDFGKSMTNDQTFCIVPEYFQDLVRVCLILALTGDVLNLVRACIGRGRNLLFLHRFFWRPSSRAYAKVPFWYLLCKLVCACVIVSCFWDVKVKAPKVEPPFFELPTEPPVEEAEDLSDLQKDVSFASNSMPGQEELTYVMGRVQQGWAWLQNKTAAAGASE